MRENFGHDWHWSFFGMLILSLAIIAWDVAVVIDGLFRLSRSGYLQALFNGMSLAFMCWVNWRLLRDGFYRVRYIGRPSICGRIRSFSPVPLNHMMDWEPFVVKQPNRLLRTLGLGPTQHFAQERFNYKRCKRIQKLMERRMQRLAPRAYVEVNRELQYQKRNFRIWFRNSMDAVEFKLRYSDEFELIDG